MKHPICFFICDVYRYCFILFILYKLIAKPYFILALSNIASHMQILSMHPDLIYLSTMCFIHFLNILSIKLLQISKFDLLILLYN
jgi:hypothetical protein